MMGRILSVIILFAELGFLAPNQINGLISNPTAYKKVQITDTNESEIGIATAYCPNSNEFLTVFLKNDIVHGQRVDASGNILGESFIIDKIHDMSPDVPVVACSPGVNDYFVVGWGSFISAPFRSIFNLQLVYGSHQAEPSSQLLESSFSLTVPGHDYMQASLACSTNGHTCLLAYSDSGITLQRLVISDLEVLWTLGDLFNITLEGVSSQHPSLVYNSVSDNYLIAWQDWSSVLYNQGIAYTHIYGIEQGPGIDETQHAEAWIYEPIVGNIYAFEPESAINQNTGMFIVIFQIAYKDGDKHHELLAQRVNGTGIGFEGPLTVLLDEREIDNPYYTYINISSIGVDNSVNQYMISMGTYANSEELGGFYYYLSVNGIYDPESSNQLIGSITQLIPSDFIDCSIIANDKNGKYLLVIGEMLNENVDLIGYLLSTNIKRLPILFNNS